VSETDVGAIDWSALAAWAALGLSAWALMQGWRVNRTATLLLRWEHTPGQQQTDELVIYNDGPALARQVGLRMLDADGDSVGLASRMADTISPIPGIPMRYEIRRPFSRGMYEAPAFVDITWRDRRWRLQRMTVPISRQTLRGPPVVSVQVDVPPDPKPGSWGTGRR
jgi:hypothetical protein